MPPAMIINDKNPVTAAAVPVFFAAFNGGSIGGGGGGGVEGRAAGADAAGAGAAGAGAVGAGGREGGGGREGAAISAAPQRVQNRAPAGTTGAPHDAQKFTLGAGWPSAGRPLLPAP